MLGSHQKHSNIGEPRLCRRLPPFEHGLLDKPLTSIEHSPCLMPSTVALRTSMIHVAQYPQRPRLREAPMPKYLTITLQLSPWTNRSKNILTVKCRRTSLVKNGGAYKILYYEWWRMVKNGERTTALYYVLFPCSLTVQTSLMTLVKAIGSLNLSREVPNIHWWSCMCLLVFRSPTFCSFYGITQRKP